VQDLPLKQVQAIMKMDHGLEIRWAAHFYVGISFQHADLHEPITASKSITLNSGNGASAKTSNDTRPSS
jgi:hypothetical protein